MRHARIRRHTGSGAGHGTVLCTNPASGVTASQSCVLCERPGPTFSSGQRGIAEARGTSVFLFLDFTVGRRSRCPTATHGPSMCVCVCDVLFISRPNAPPRPAYYGRFGLPLTSLLTRVHYHILSLTQGVGSYIWPGIWFATPTRDRSQNGRARATAPQVSHRSRNTALLVLSFNVHMSDTRGEAEGPVAIEHRAPTYPLSGPLP